jgi:hypothetical protein
MEPQNELYFSLSDRLGDAEVRPANVPLSLLGEFQRDITEFLRGSVRDIDPAQVLVSVQEGSLRLNVSGLMSATTLWADLARLDTPNGLNRIDPKRAAVLERWQASTRANPSRRYCVIDGAGKVSVSVSADTNVRRAEEVWVMVEKYIHGKVLDWGGKVKPNIHLELDDGSVLKVAATQQLLAKEEQNRLYRPVLLHISAEENLMTGAIRNPVLLAFEAHQPVFDETEFQRMVERGTAAWSGISDPSEWLEGIRGGHA